MIPHHSPQNANHQIYRIATDTFLMQGGGGDHFSGQRRFDTGRISQKAMDILQPGAADKMLNHHMVGLLFHIGTKISFRFGLWRKSDIAALAFNWQRPLHDRDQGGYTKPRSRPDHKQRCTSILNAVEDLAAVTIGCVMLRKRLSSEIIDHEQFIQCQPLQKPGFVKPPVIVGNIDNLVIDRPGHSQAQYMTATLLVTGKTGQKSFKGILKAYKIRASQMRDVTKRRFALRRDGESGVCAAYISNYESHDGHLDIFTRATMTIAPAPIF